MSKTVLGSGNINSDGIAKLIFNSTGDGDVTVIAESEGLTSNEFIIHDYLYAPPFTSNIQHQQQDWIVDIRFRNQMVN